MEKKSGKNVNFKGKRVTVVGLGNSGVSASLLLAKNGATVFATDAGTSAELIKAKGLLESKGISVEVGSHTDDFIKGSELVVVSPGVENSSYAIKSALKYKIPIISEMELGYRFCKGRIIAITGTNGKSTVTTLIGKILIDGRKDTVVCGNIGNSLCGEIDKIGKDTWVVLEVSSAQLERIEYFKPNIAIMLNITDDHMDRYKDFYEYLNYKLKIYENQDQNDVLIINYDAENLRKLKGLSRSRQIFYSKAKTAPSGFDIGAYVKDEWISCVYGNSEKEIIHINDIKLKGVHNLENVIVSSLVAMMVGISERSIRDSIRGFTGLEHRFETVGMLDGVEYIDDSKSTTVDSTIRALESCQKPVVLIAGGKDKHSNYTLVRDAVKSKVRYVILIGEATPVIKKALEGTAVLFESKDMYDAVEKANKIAEDGWAVLLSPMCSSFDMFKNYKERGMVFQEAVKKLRSNKEGVKA